jgi:hypothetical protein
LKQPAGRFVIEAVPRGESGAQLLRPVEAGQFGARQPRGLQFVAQPRKARGRLLVGKARPAGGEPLELPSGKNPLGRQCYGALRPVEHPDEIGPPPGNELQLHAAIERRQHQCRAHALCAAGKVGDYGGARTIARQRLQLVAQHGESGVRLVGRHAHDLPAIGGEPGQDRDRRPAVDAVFDHRGRAARLRGLGTAGKDDAVPLPRRECLEDRLV